MQRPSARNCLLALLVLTASTLGIPQSASPWGRVARPSGDSTDPTSSINANRVGSAGKRDLWVTSLTGKSWITRDGGKIWVANIYPPGVAVEGGLAFVESDQAW